MNSSSEISIRSAQEKDARAIAEIHVASWQKIYRSHIPDTVLDNLSISEREQQWRALINNKVNIWLIEKNNEIVGFVSICPSRDPDTDPNTCGEISAIYLNPNVWHQGLGKKLCNKALTEMGNMGFSEAILWVLQENKLAREFYERMGFINTNNLKADQYDKDVILNEVKYIKKLKNNFSFKPLQEDDLKLLCKWLDKPHVKEWWDDGLNHQEIKEKYRQRIGDETVVPFIAYLENSPIGFIQYYHADKVGDGWWADEIEGTVGIDQFIGEENYINRGYGREMICAFGQKLFENPAIKKIITDVDPANIRAIRCYEKAGLRMMGDVETPDGKAHLMVAYRNKSIEPHAYLLEKPPLETLLYKIIPSNFFIDMLDKNYMYFRRVDTYPDDKRDSDQPNNDKELSDKSKFENAPNYSAKNYYDDCRSRTYTCCFSTENTGHIWEHYAGTDNNAVCIVFNSSKLINLLNAIFDESRLEYDGKKFKNFFYINYGLVTYGNLDNQLMDELLPNPIQYVYFKDATKYSEEKEFRISLSCIGIGKIKLPDNSYFNFPESIQLDFDLIKAINLKVIEKIYLSSNHASILLNTISEKLKNKISADDIDRLLTPLEQL